MTVNDMTCGEALLPCPFCGGTASTIYDSGNEIWGQSWRTGCTKCSVQFKARGSSSWRPIKIEDDAAKAKSIAAWNQRSEGEAVYQERLFQDRGNDKWEDIEKSKFDGMPNYAKRILYTHPLPVAIGGLSDEQWGALFSTMEAARDMEQMRRRMLPAIANAGREWLANNAAPVVSDEIVKAACDAYDLAVDGVMLANLSHPVAMRAALAAALQRGR